MTENIHYCPNCGWERPMEQHHASPGWCPDATDGQCPEWFCLTCGTAMILGGAPASLEAPSAVGIRDRVA